MPPPPPHAAGTVTHTTAGAAAGPLAERNERSPTHSNSSSSSGHSSQHSSASPTPDSRKQQGQPQRKRCPHKQASAFHDELSADLRGLLQVGKLENIIHRLLTRIEDQQTRIVDLETILAERMPSLPTLHRFEQRLDTKLGALERRISHVDARIDAVDAPLSRINANTAKVNHAIDLLDRKVDTTTFNTTRAELAQLVAQSIEELDKRKAPKGVFTELEDSQHHVQAQMAALQGMMTTKVDRTEVPLLAAAHETLAKLAQFKEKAEPRIDAIEQVQHKHSTALGEKEDKTAIIARMQNIHEHLLTKADVDWVDEKLCAPLRTMQNTVERFAVNEQELSKLVVEQQNTNLNVKDLSDRLEEGAKETSRLHRDLRAAMVNVLKRTDLDEFDERAREQSKFHSKLIDERTEAMKEETKIHAAYLADIRRQITAIKGAHAETNKKVGVAMRFVDWFAEMKLMQA